MAKDKAIILFIIITALMFLLLGFVIGKMAIIFPRENISPVNKLSEREIRRECIEQLRLKAILPPLPNELYTLSGNILEIKEDSLIIKPEEDRVINTLGLTFSEKTEVKFDESTVLQERKWEAGDNFVQEMEAYTKAIKEGQPAEGLKTPGEFQYIDITRERFNSGDLVLVKSRENILKNEIITATEIILINSTLVE